MDAVFIKVNGEWERDIPTVDLSLCQYDKAQRRLRLTSEHIGMPRAFIVRSHKTGKTVNFVPVTESDPLFDQDQWDGEQQIYRPLDNVPNVEYLVIYNQY